MKYLPQNVTAEVLAEVGQRVVKYNATEHPVDIAAAMTVAIDGAAEALAVLMERDLL